MENQDAQQYQTMLDWNFQISFFSVSVSVTQDDMIGSDGNTLGSPKDEGLVVHFLCDHVQPGVELLIVHLELVWPDDSLAGAVTVEDPGEFRTGRRGFVTLLRLRPVSVCMELSVVISTLVDELVDETTKLKPMK